MDYYKKYQKYKLKYLNLLNQFGGGYTPEQFTQMLIKNKENNEELLNEVDFLTFEKINIKTAILINMQVYDVNSLFKWIQKKYNNKQTPTLPLTNGNFSLSNLLDIRNKLDNDDKKNIIKDIIVLQLPERVQNIFKELNKEQLDIIFTITKISILKDLSIDLIEELFSKYKYLLNNNIIDNEIIDALKKDYSTLLLVPEKKMTDNIIELAVIQNGFALVYVPVHMIKPDICEIAVKNNGNTLKYIPNNLRTFKICEAAVKQNGRAFHDVLADKMTSQEYLIICNIAVKHNGTILKFVPKDFRTYEICKSAVEDDGSALYYVLGDKMTSQEYFIICSIAVEKNANALKYVLVDKMTSQEYFIICSIAVEKDAFALKYVLADKMTSQEYLIICNKAVEKDADALYYVPDELKNELKKYFGGECMSEAEANAKIHVETTERNVTYMDMDEYNKRLKELMCYKDQPQQQRYQPANHGQQMPNHGQQILNHGHQQQILNPGQRKDLAFIANDIGETLNIFKSHINPLLNGQKNLELAINEFIMVMNNKLEFFKTDCNCNCVSLNKQILLS